jgi:hypothetical protein
LPRARIDRGGQAIGKGFAAAAGGGSGAVLVALVGDVGLAVGGWLDVEQAVASNSLGKFLVP